LIVIREQITEALKPTENEETNDLLDSEQQELSSKKLKNILSNHPGTTEVQIEVQHADHSTLLQLDANLRVSVNPGLYGDLKQLLGPSCLTPPKTLVN
jgi:DNA polymerase III alpha subunit